MERLIALLLVAICLLGCQQTAEPITAERNLNEGALNLATATAEELAEIPGLRAGLIPRIIEFQKSPGFRRVEDLLAIKGIGEKTYERLKAWFYVVHP